MGCELISVLLLRHFIPYCISKAAEDVTSRIHLSKQDSKTQESQEAIENEKGKEKGLRVDVDELERVLSMNTSA